MDRFTYAGRFWCYFRGTRNGRWISAASVKSAKWIFALKHNLNSVGYIAGSKFGPHA